MEESDGPADGPPLSWIAAEAAALRGRGAWPLSSYSRKVFIPLTQLCRDVCHYCTFARAAARAASRLSLARRGAGDRARRRGGRLHGGAVHARRQAGAALRAARRGARRARPCDARSTISRAMCALVLRGDRPAAARQSRRHDARRDRRAARGVGVAGHHAGERQRAAVRAGRRRITARPTSSRRCGSRRSRRRASSACRSPPAS